MKNLSIIIPLGPGEDQVNGLLSDLLTLTAEAEIILVSSGDTTNQILHHDRITVINARQGRAAQQNAGANAASRTFVWFLHADTRVTPQGVDALAAALSKAPDAFHYFHLKFADDGPRWMGLNEWGARVRSEIFSLPFGDQGFCLSRNTFNKVGGFPEHVPYGEDLLLVWYARQAGVCLRCTGTQLQTSARKYRQQGWGALTTRYQFRWIKQSLPELYKLILGKRR